MQDTKGSKRKDLEVANWGFLVFEIGQLVCFAIGMTLNHYGHKRCYVFVTWIEDFILEIPMVYSGWVIGDRLKVPMSNFLVVTGAILNLGVVIFETYRECKDNDLTCCDET